MPPISKPTSTATPSSFTFVDHVVLLIAIVATYIALVSIVPLPTLSSYYHSNPTTIQVVYWPVQGRAEQVRLALVLAGQTWQEVHVSDAEYANKTKAGSVEHPFGQWPLLRGEDGVIAQSEAIMRYIGRKYLKSCDLSLQQHLVVDQILPGIDALRGKYGRLIWADKLSHDGLAKFYTDHVDPASKNKKNDGAHLAYIHGFFERRTRSVKSVWVTGSSRPTIADVAIYNVFSNIRRLFPPKTLDVLYPRLAAHREAFLNIPEIAQYVSSPRMFEHVNDDDGIGDGEQ